MLTHSSIHSTDSIGTFKNLNIESAANVFHDALIKVLTSFVPTKIINNDNKFPYWFNKELKTLVWKKNKAHSTCTKHRTKLNYEKFSNLRSQYKSKSKLLFREFICRSERDIKTNPKSFWKWVSYNTRSQDLPNTVFLDNKSVDSGEAIADLFSSYFSSVYRSTDIPLPNASSYFPSIQKFFSYASLSLYHYSRRGIRRILCITQFLFPRP